MKEPLTCRICLEDGGHLIAPCDCKGTSGHIHAECLNKWVKESGNTECEICKAEYAREEVCACNVERYWGGCCSFQHSSEIEEGLIRVSPLHVIMTVLVYASLLYDEWLLFYSIQTLTITLSVIMTQIYYHDVDFFVVNVCLWWSTATLFGVVVIGVIRSMDNLDRCNNECMHVSSSMCIESCPIYQYFTRDEGIIDQTMILSFGQVCVLLVVKSIMLCFTHMRKAQYRNRRLPTEASSTESVALLSSSSSV